MAHIHKKDNLLIMREIKVQAKSLSALSFRKSLFELTYTWGRIGLILYFYIYFQTWWAFVIAFILIGATQYALLILLHDASHTLIHSNKKINNTIALWFIAAPCGSSFFNSRRLHLLHHQNLGRLSEDPDFFYYSFDGVSPKNSRKKLVLHFIKLICGAQIYHTLFNDDKNTNQQQENLRLKIINSFRALLPVLVVQSIIFSIFFFLNIWWCYFFLWVLPLITLAVFLNGLRTFADHANPMPDDFNTNNLAITYQSNSLELFFLAPFHMNYHAEHHLFPYVPHYNLYKIRELINQYPSLKENIQFRKSYLGTLINYFHSLKN